MSNRAISPIPGGAVASASFVTITAGVITDTGLSQSRVVFVGAGGLLTDDAGFTFNASSDVLTATGGVRAGGLTISSALLLHTTIALADGTGAQAATTLNGPTAGNPTKWIPIDDNGTTRYIPAW